VQGTDIILATTKENIMHEQTTFGSMEAASLGGKARAKSMSEADRRESARLAAEARWAKAGKSPSVRRATHAGNLKLGNIEIACAVLEDGTRVISERGLLTGLGIKYGGALSRARESENGAGRLPLFVGYKNLRPFVDQDLAALLQNPVEYRAIQGGNPAHGLRAELIPKVCGVWLSARDAGVLAKGQIAVAAKADILIRGLAEVGIVALVDEATGYQADRSRDALAKILEAFIAKELRPWVRTFEPEFYQELFRLRGIQFTGTLKAPRFIGKLTNDLVYDRLAPGVREELNRINPSNEKGQRRHKNFQWLTNHLGYQKLKQHLAAITVLMKVFDEWDAFKKSLDRALPKQLAAPLFDPPAQG
jgi:hypothetical protein